MKKRYYEIRVNSADLPVNRRVVHVVTWNEESPLNRAVAEGLLERDHLPKVSIRELSVDECLQAWNRSKWRKQ
ncbi:MAG: hypothetical protein H0X66_05395 [Verrucomicrobia bacterium]|nr:hypothetical protein [Verrucomicrobiota bacterium]